MPNRYPREFRRQSVSACSRASGSKTWRSTWAVGVHVLPVEAPGADRRRARGRHQSFEAAEFAQAHQRIADLEDELEITRAAAALFNGEETVGPKGGARLPRR